MAFCLTFCIEQSVPFVTYSLIFQTLTEKLLSRHLKEVLP